MQILGALQDAGGKTHRHECGGVLPQVAVAVDSVSGCAEHVTGCSVEGAQGHAVSGQSLHRWDGRKEPQCVPAEHSTASMHVVDQGKASMYHHTTPAMLKARLQLHLCIYSHCCMRLASMGIVPSQMVLQNHCVLPGHPA